MQWKIPDLKELLSKRNSDDCDAKYDAQQIIDQRQHPPAYQEPDDIQQERYCFTFIANLFSERAQGKVCQLEALQADRNTDYRATPETACQHPSNGTQKAAEYNP